MERAANQWLFHSSQYEENNNPLSGSAVDNYPRHNLMVDIYPPKFLNMDNYAPSIDMVDMNATIMKRG